jgi:hypothetical protein
MSSAISSHKSKVSSLQTNPSPSTRRKSTGRHLVLLSAGGMASSQYELVGWFLSWQTSRPRSASAFATQRDLRLYSNCLWFIVRCTFFGAGSTLTLTLERITSWLKTTRSSLGYVHELLLAGNV